VTSGAYPVSATSAYVTVSFVPLATTDDIDAATVPSVTVHPWPDDEPVTASETVTSSVVVDVVLADTIDGRAASKASTDAEAIRLPAASARPPSSGAVYDTSAIAPRPIVSPYESVRAVAASSLVAESVSSPAPSTDHSSATVDPLTGSEKVSVTDIMSAGRGENVGATLSITGGAGADTESCVIPDSVPAALVASIENVNCPSMPGADTAGSTMYAATHAPGVGQYVIGTAMSPPTNAIVGRVSAATPADSEINTLMLSPSRAWLS